MTKPSTSTVHDPEPTPAPDLAAGGSLTRVTAEPLCLDGHVVSSGATWCCNLRTGHDGPHSDGLGDTWPVGANAQTPDPADFQPDTFDEWAIVELLGHRKVAGRVRETTLAGVGMLRIDIPATDGDDAQTQFVSPSSVYALHPTTQTLATAMAARYRPAPVARWELPEWARYRIELAEKAESEQEWRQAGMDATAEPDPDYGRDLDDEDDDDEPF